MIYNSIYYYYKNICISRFYEKFYFLDFLDIPFFSYLKIQFNFITLDNLTDLKRNYIINLFFFLEEFTSIKSVAIKKKVNYKISLRSTIILFQYKIITYLIKNYLYNFLLYLMLIILPLSQKISLRKIIRNIFSKGLLIRISTFLQIPSLSDKSTELFNNLIVNIIINSKNIFLTKYFLQNFNLTFKNYKK